MLEARGLLGLPRGSLCDGAIPWTMLAGATGATSGYVCQPSTSLEYRLWGYWGYLGAPFANQANPWNTGSGATGATSWLPFQTSKSLEYKLWGY